MGKWYNNKIPIVIICSKGASLSNLGCLAGNCRMKPHLCPIPHFLDWTASGREESAMVCGSGDLSSCLDFAMESVLVLGITLHF